MASVVLMVPYFREDIGKVRYCREHENPFPSHGVLLLGTLLRDAGHTVRIVDMQREIIALGGDEEACLQKMGMLLLELQPDIIGISFFTYLFPEARRIIRYARTVIEKAGIQSLFIAGGVHPTVEPIQTLNDLAVDYVCVGEGEKALLSLAAGIDPDTIPGIASKCNPSPPPAELISDLDSLPFPDYSLIDWSFYASPTSSGFKRDKASSTLDLFFSRGCVFSCGFCAFSSMGRPRFHSAAYVIENMRIMESRYGVTDFQFWDSTLGTNKPLLMDFCEQLLANPQAREWTWRACIRVDQVDRQLLELMKKAGCIYLFFGFESATQKDLDRMNKKVRVADNYSAARLCNEVGIYYNASVIINYPGQNENDFLQIERFLLDVSPPAISINVYSPFPGSHDWAELKKSGIISPENDTAWRKLGESTPYSIGTIYADVDKKTMSLWYDRLILLRDRLQEVMNNRGDLEVFRANWLRCTSRLSKMDTDLFSAFYAMGLDGTACNWQTCFYGDGGKLVSHEGQMIFISVSSQDHASTEFIDLPHDCGDVTQLLRLRLQFGNNGCVGGWQIAVQDEEYNTLVRIACEEEVVTFERTFPILSLPGINRVRLTFLPDRRSEISSLPKIMTLETNLVSI